MTLYVLYLRMYHVMWVAGFLLNNELGKHEESEVTDVLFRAFLGATKKNHTGPLTIVGATA